MIARNGWFGDYSDPTTFLDLLQSDNGNNSSRMKDAKYDNILARAAAQLDKQKRLSLLRDAEHYLLTEAVPFVPLYQYRTVNLYRPNRLRGVSLHPRALQMFHLMEVAD